MKIVLIAVAMACAGTVQAATPFDIGPEGKSFVRSYAFGQLNGVQMNGQTVSFDLYFNNNIHLFQGTNSDFGIFLGFQTTGTSNIGFAAGDGFVLDGSGNQMCGLRDLASANSDTGAFGVGLYPLHSDSSGAIALDVSRPLDFYGVHFDIILPDNGLFITAGGFGFSAQELFFNGNHSKPFRVGPYIPDNGSTFLLFGVGITALFIGRFDRTTKQAVEKGN